MKKIIYFFVLIFGFYACDRELDFSSDFEFEIRNIDDTEIFINTIKSFQLEITSLKNVDNNKDYLFSYEVLSGGLTVKDGSNTLIEGNSYPFTVNSTNFINLDLIPNYSGQTRVKFNLTDNNGVTKSKEVLVLCTDQDFSYTFTGVVPNPNGNVTTNIPFTLNIVNTGLSQNQFQVKYISTGSGNVLIGGNTMPNNQYFNVQAGTIQGLYTSTSVGSQDVTFTCIDANGQEIQIVLTFNFTAIPFALAKINDFSVKNTLQNDFKFTLTNTLSTATYQIKFTSLNPSKVFLGTTQLSMNSWLNLSLITNNLYTYRYEANSDINDVLTVEVKDSYGQVQTINYNVTVFSRPVINNFNIQFSRSTPNCHSTFFGQTCSCNGITRSNTINTITGGAILIKTRIIIKNKLTGNFDTLDFNNANVQNQLESVLGTSSGTNGSATGALISSYNNSRYAGQLYSIQIQDSDGVWSAVGNGTVQIL